MRSEDEGEMPERVEKKTRMKLNCGTRPSAPHEVMKLLYSLKVPEKSMLKISALLSMELCMVSN